MPKTVRRSRLQPVLESLDRRIAPSTIALAAAAHPTGHAPIVFTPPGPHTNIGPVKPPGGGTSPPTP